MLPDNGAPFRFVRAQETELPREVSLGFTRRRRRLSPRGRAVAPAGRRRVARVARRSCGRHRRHGGRAARRDLAAGSVGRPRKRGVRAAAEPAGADAGRRRRADRGWTPAGCWRSARSSIPATARVRARSIDPEVFEQPLRAAAASRAAARRRPMGRCMRWRSICRRCPARSRRCWRGSQSPPIPGRDRSASGARRTAFRMRARRRRWLRPSSARRSTTCRGARPRAGIGRAFACGFIAGALASVSDAALFGGANAAALRRAGRRLGGDSVRRGRTGRRAHL